MKTKEVKPSRFKSAVLSWLGFGYTDIEHWIQWYGRESASGERVTIERALTLSAVWACVRLVSQTIATLPLSLYRRTDDGRVIETDHPVQRIIRNKPNDSMTAVVFWEAMVAAALFGGDAWAEKKHSAGRLVSLEFLDPRRLTPNVTTKGDPTEYRYIEADGTMRMIKLSAMFHIPGFSLNGKTGLSVIAYGVEVFGSALAANRAANGTFNKGLMPTTYFKMDRVLNKEQRTEFRENLDALSGALNAGTTPLLEGGMDIGHLGINPNDAQLLESRTFGVEEVARWFGVPPSMIGSTDKASSWASSAEAINLWFLQYGLRPWLKRIEEAIWDGLLAPEEQAALYAEFSVEGLLRADTAGRSSLYSQALQNGWMSRNEVRRLENLPSVDGGDIYTAQSNLLPLDKLGQAQTPATSLTINNPAADVEDAAASADVQATALNGAQVVALQEIVAAVADGQLPLDSAGAMIAAAFPLLTEDQINAMLDPLAKFRPRAGAPDAVDVLAAKLVERDLDEA